MPIGVDVARGAEFEGNATVAHEGGEAAELFVAGRTADVVDDANTMAEALGAAELHGLPDARQSEGLTGVNGGVEVLALDEVEGLEMSGGRVAGLGAGDVEAHHAGIAPTHGELGDLETARRGAHGRQDRVDREIGAGRTASEARHDRVGHFVEGEPGLGGELGCETHFGVHHAVGGEILRAFEGHALDGVTVLHDPDGVGEGLEIEHEIVALGAAVEPAREIVDVGGGESLVTELGSEFDDGGRPQATVEVVVQEDLGVGEVLADVDGHAFTRREPPSSRRSGRSGVRCNQFQSG